MRKEKQTPPVSYKENVQNFYENARSVLRVSTESPQVPPGSPSSGYTPYPRAFLSSAL